MITLSIQALFIAKGRTWIVLASAIISAVSNYLFGKGLIFGNSIFPEMGLEGAALASTIADGISMLFLIVMLLVSKEKADYKLLSHFSIDKDSFKELLNIGSPLMFQGFIALATTTTPQDVIRLASPNNDVEFAQSLYASLRKADELGLSHVVIEQPTGSGIAVAIRDRLMRAANGR